MAKNDYQALAEVSNPFVENSSQHHETIGIDETTTDTENEDGNRDNGIMIHVVPDTGKGWFEILKFGFLNIFFYSQLNALLTNFLSCYSTMESHRRLGLILYTNVFLPSKTWFHCHDAQLYIGSCDFCICCVVCYGCYILR